GSPGAPRAAAAHAALTRRAGAGTYRARDGGTGNDRTGNDRARDNRAGQDRQAGPLPGAEPARQVAPATPRSCSPAGPDSKRRMVVSGGEYACTLTAGCTEALITSWT